MRTLIVLCAGNRIAGDLPLYLNRHPDGKLLAEKALEDIFPEVYDRIVYTILEEADQKYNAKKLLLDNMGDKYPVEIFALPRLTNGPAETVYETVKKLSITGEFAVRDSLNAIKLIGKVQGNFVAGLDLTEYSRDIFNARSKSFIVINEQHHILDIIEKKFCSDVISTGFYGFSCVDDFVMAYERLSDKSYPIQKLYLSNVISYLIGYKQRIFHCAEVSEFEEWGSQEAWMDLQKRYALCFADLDQLFGTSDISQLDEFDIKMLKRCAESRLSFVFFTSSANIDAEKARNFFVERGINCFQVIVGAPCSKVRIFINSREELNNAILGV